jgi:hypothetical protein
VLADGRERPASRSPSGAVSVATRSASRIEAITSTRSAPSRSISSANAVRALPAPNTVRAGSWS